jgi:type III secretion protein V
MFGRRLNIRGSDLVLMALVMAIAAMLIVPLPSPLLDLLLVLNLSLSILLLLVGLYVGSSSALFTFPSILLLTTLFRLGLNVASSRLILSQGEAGRVIEAFGTFLTGGEVVVGLIIFAIITVVNFIVISNGAARVSEVAARFALDALPGRQMMIDTDARAGVISADEASRKRDDLSRESQLYGSMDGAMKFVQGDAIAGIILILTNICGGMYMGISSGLGFSEAIQTYTVLTVGDGLVAQIPSLLTSICAGIIVTRVSSSERSSLSSDLQLQLFSQPIALVVTAGVLLFISLMPGIPMIPFIIAACALGGIGFWSSRHQHGGLSIERKVSSNKGDFSALSGESDVNAEGTLVLSLDKGSLYRIYRARMADYANSWSVFKGAFYDDTGISLPGLNVVVDELLPHGTYCVRSFGIELLSGSIPDDSVLVETSITQAAVLGFKVLREEEHPVSGHRLFWTERSARNTTMLDAARIAHHDFFGFISLRLAQLIREHPEDVVSVTYIHSMLRQIEKRYPGLVADAFGKDFVSVPKLAEITQELIRQGVSIRDFRSIMECIAAYCSTAGIASAGESQVELAEVVHFVRASKRRQIVRRFVGSCAALPVLTLSPNVEGNFEDASADRWTTSLAMAPELYDTLLQGLFAVVRPALAAGSLPIALLCSRGVKEKVISFVRMSGLRIFVTTLDEIDPSFPVMQIGVWDAEV